MKCKKKHNIDKVIVKDSSVRSGVRYICLERRKEYAEKYESKRLDSGKIK